jgi:uncharacterized protein (DUF362 family)
MLEESPALYIDSNLIYPTEFPYHPDKAYPELTNIFSKPIPTNKENNVYAAVRELFKLCNLDSKNCGTVDWNPLSGIIKPKQNILIKPNLVMHEIGLQSEVNVMHTHGSIIRAVADYALLALKGTGELIVADSPLQGADFNEIVNETGLKEIMEFYNFMGISNFYFYDLRKEWAQLSKRGGMTLNRVVLRGDPKGYHEVELGYESCLEPITTYNTVFSITGYQDSVTQNNHKPGLHKYLVSGSVLEADVILNLPKLKTHMKTGMTGCLKNLVGINVSKDYLPHHRKGSIAEGGDEYPEKTIANQLFKKVRDALNEKAPLIIWRIVRWFGLRFRNIYSDLFDKRKNKLWAISPSMVYGGSWYGNDTAWRMVHDLNKILFFADKEGVIQKKEQRKCFSIIDAIIAGEAEGPLTCSAKHCGILLGGTDPMRIDTTAAILMGFDPLKIPMLNNRCSSPRLCFSNFDPEKDDINVKSNVNSSKDWYKGFFRFKPPQGWVNHIEI